MEREEQSSEFAPAYARAACGEGRPGVNPPQECPAVSAATAHRRSAQPSSTAMMARAGSPLFRWSSAPVGAGYVHSFRNVQCWFCAKAAE